MNNNTDMTVNEAVVQKMEELRKAGRVNSWYRYRSMLHALESYGGAGIPFERLTPLWLSGCESAWRSSGRNSTTISIYMKSLRCIFHLHHGGPGPFASYRIPRPSMRRMALPSSGIRSILQWRGSDGPLAESRDLWLFSYLCNGINFKDMLQLSRIENGAYTGLEEVNFVELFNETTHDLNEIFAYKDIRCRLEGESELKASAHPALCQLLVANLCRNAYVHTPQAGTLSIVWGNKDFSVCNTGPKALDSSHIFQRFYKDSSNPSSTGLGLSLCQAICQQYHWPLTYSYKNGEHIFHVALCPQPNS